MFVTIIFIGILVKNMLVKNHVLRNDALRNDALRNDVPRIPFHARDGGDDYDALFLNIVVAPLLVPKQ